MVFNPRMTDSQIIQNLGGATAVAKRLGFDLPDGARRVHNWIARGIPARVKLENSRLFNSKQAKTPASRAQAAIKAEAEVAHG